MTSAQFLQPKFEFFPTELTQLSRWVGFDTSKRPLRASNPPALASIKDPSHWATFDETKAFSRRGGCAGIGIVLNGDGLVGFDFDSCVEEGTPDSTVMDFLDRHGVGYIEFSPSGRGIRAFGYADQKEFPDWPFSGRRGKIENMGIELYADQRFLTVTGHVIRNEGLFLITELPGILEKIHPAHLQKTADEHIGNLLFSSGALPSSSVGNDAIHSLIPTSCIPSRYGERHHCLFRLARVLRAKFPNCSPETCREIVQRWHQICLPNIHTKEFAISWSEFTVAWEKIKYPMGLTLAGILAREDKDVSELAKKFGYGEKMQALIQFCLKLQDHFGQEPFYLSARKAGELLCIHHTDAGRLLRVLVADGLLDLVSKGSGKKASRYLINSEVS